VFSPVSFRGGAFQKFITFEKLLLNHIFLSVAKFAGRTADYSAFTLLRYPILWYFRLHFLHSMSFSANTEVEGNGDAECWRAKKTAT